MVARRIYEKNIWPRIHMEWRNPTDLPGDIHTFDVATRVRKAVGDGTFVLHDVCDEAKWDPRGVVSPHDCIRESILRVTHTVYMIQLFGLPGLDIVDMYGDPVNALDKSPETEEERMKKLLHIPV